MEQIIDNKVVDSNIVDSQQVMSSPKQAKVKPKLTSYQKYKQMRNVNGKKYFEFYDDVKSYTHKVYDW